MKGFKLSSSSKIIKANNELDRAELRAAKDFWTIGKMLEGIADISKNGEILSKLLLNRF